MSKTEYDDEDNEEIEETQTTDESAGYHGSKDDFYQYKQILKQSYPTEFVSNRKKPRLTDQKIQFSLVLGARGSGKSVMIEQDAEFYYKKGITILYLWAARSNENVFIGVNCRCKEKWEALLDRQRHLTIKYKTKQGREKWKQHVAWLESRLHCKCHDAYPVSWLVPDYWQFSDVEEYNTCWSGKDEYNDALKKELITKQYYELTLKEREALQNRKLKKPRYLVKQDLIRICPFTVPNNPKNSEEFGRQFINYLLEARKERRWLVMNPLMFLTPEDKFKTITYILKHIRQWMEQNFQPNTPESVARLRGQKTPVPEMEWNRWERNWHKAALVFSELRTLAPTNKYSPETQSATSKRVLVDQSAELRHANLYVMGDLQNAEDLNESIKPLTDYVIIKNSTYQLLGKEYYTFLQLIENKRKNYLLGMTHGKHSDFSKAPPTIKSYIDHFMPRVQELPINKAYVVWPNNEYKLITVNGASWHHKQEGESLQSITGITWTLKKELEKKILQEKDTDEIEGTEDKLQRLSKQDSYMVLKWCIKEHITNHLSWDRVLEKLRDKIKSTDSSDRLPTTGIEDLRGTTLSNRITLYPELKSALKFAKNHKDLPLKDRLAPLNYEK